MTVTLNEHIRDLLKNTDCVKTAETLQRITTLFEVIKHGEQGHMDWLETAIHNHFMGLPMPDYVAK